MGWIRKRFAEVCVLQRGFDLPKKDRKNGKFPLVSSSGYIDFHSEAKVQGPGVVTGRSGSIGQVFYVKEDFWPLNTALYIKDFHGNDPRFIYYLLKSFDLSRYTSGAGVPTLNRNHVHDEIVLVPTDIEEQKRIVSVLDQAFAKIEQARAKTEQNLKNARDLFESYLQKVFSQRGEGWVDRTLAEVSLDFGRGKSKHRPRNDESLYRGRYPFIQTGDVRNCEHLITSYSKTYNDKGLAQSKLWPKGTICITIAANIAETGILNFEGCFPDSIIGVVVNPEVATISYVEYLLQSFKVILQSQGKGSAQDNINMGTFENRKFPFPAVSKQKEIVSSLSRLMTSVQQLEVIYFDKLETLDELKKSILHLAFSGELTNKDAEGAAA